MAQGQQFPAPNEPIADKDGKITRSWFAALNSIWQKASGGSGTVTSVGASSPIASSGGSTPVISLNNSGVSAGSYTSTNLTVNAKGLITAASNGSGGGGVTTTGSPASGNLTKFSGSSTITNADLTGDVTTSGTVATTIANNAVTNAKLATEAQSTIKGRAAGAGTGTVTDLTATQATAILDVMVGDSGSGGTKGLVPAPAAGDAAAGKFLKADGTFVVPPSGSGTVTHTAGALTSGQLVVGNGSADIKVVSGTNGQIPIAATSDGTVQFASLTPGSNISITPGAHSITIGATSGTGGTGNSIYTGAAGSEPGGINSGDAYLPNNGFVLERYSGSGWVPWGPLFPMVDPNLAGITTWVNQGGATVSSANGGIVLSTPAGSGSDSVRLRVKTAPATPYTITAAYLCNFPFVSGVFTGLVWRDSSSGKFTQVGPFYSSGVQTQKLVYAALKWSSPTTFSAYYTLTGGGTNVMYSEGPIHWIRIADDGATRTAGVSTDGQNFTTILSVGRTDFQTPDQVGFSLDAPETAYPAMITLLSWKEQ